MQAEEIRESMDLSLEAAAIARRGGYGGAEVNALANAVEISVECGAWDVADGLLEDLRARTDLPAGNADTVAIGAVLLAAYRGDRSTADELIDGLSEEITASADPSIRAWYHRVLSVVSLMAGDLERAYDESMVAVDADPAGPNSAIAAWCAGRAALWSGDAAKARATLERAPGMPGRWVTATRRAIEAGIAALEGHEREAATMYDSVLAGRLAQGDRFTHALATVDAVAVLPHELVPEGAVETARTYLEELSAAPLLSRLTISGPVPPASPVDRATASP